MKRKLMMILRCLVMVFKLDSVDATEIVVLLDKVFDIKISESDDPSYMRSINSLATFVIQKKND